VRFDIGIDEFSGVYLKSWFWVDCFAFGGLLIALGF
jgi:hypothetical protein